MLVSNVWSFAGESNRPTVNQMLLGFQPVSLSAQVYAHAVSLHGSLSWSIRLQIAFLFPKLTQQEELLLQEKITELQQTA
jgi:hypothetical protein